MDVILKEWYVRKRDKTVVRVEEITKRKPSRTNGSVKPAMVSYVTMPMLLVYDVSLEGFKKSFRPATEEEKAPHTDALKPPPPTFEPPKLAPGRITALREASTKAINKYTAPCSKLQQEVARANQVVLLLLDVIEGTLPMKEASDERVAPLPSKPKGMRRIDGADVEAQRLFDMVRDGKDDQEVVDAIAESLRKIAQGPRKWGILR